MNHDVLKIWVRHFSRANKTLTYMFFILTYYWWYYLYIITVFIVLQLQWDSPDMLRWIRLRLRKSMGHSQLGTRIWSSVGRCWEKAEAPFEPKLCPCNLSYRCRMPRTACQAGTFHLMNVNKVYSFACINIDLAMAKTGYEKKQKLPDYSIWIQGISCRNLCEWLILKRYLILLVSKTCNLVRISPAYRHVGPANSPGCASFGRCQWKAVFL